MGVCHAKHQSPYSVPPLQEQYSLYQHKYLHPSRLSLTPSPQSAFHPSHLQVINDPETLVMLLDSQHMFSFLLQQKSPFLLRDKLMSRLSAVQMAQVLFCLSESIRRVTSKSAFRKLFGVLVDDYYRQLEELFTLCQSSLNTALQDSSTDPEPIQSLCVLLCKCFDTTFLTYWIINYQTFKYVSSIRTNMKGCYLEMTLSKAQGKTLNNLRNIHGHKIKHEVDLQKQKGLKEEIPVRPSMSRRLSRQTSCQRRPSQKQMTNLSRFEKLEDKESLQLRVVESKEDLQEHGALQVARVSSVRPLQSRMMSRFLSEQPVITEENSSQEIVLRMEGIMHAGERGSGLQRKESQYDELEDKRQGITGQKLTLVLGQQKQKLSKIDNIKGTIDKAYHQLNHYHSLHHLEQEMKYKQLLEEFCYLAVKQQKEKHHLETMNRLCLELQYFQSYCQEDPSRKTSLQEVLKYMQLRTGQKGEALFMRGDPEDCFYVVAVGEVCLLKRKGNKAMARQIQDILLKKKRKQSTIGRTNTTRIDKLAYDDLIRPEQYFEQEVFKYDIVRQAGKGETLGDLAIGTLGIREHTALFVEDTILIRISKDKYEQVLMQHKYLKLQNQLKFFSKCFFEAVRHTELLWLVQVSTKHKYIYQDMVARKGEPMGSIMVVKRGQVESYDNILVARTQSYKNNLVQAICTAYNKHQDHSSTRIKQIDTYCQHSIIGLHEYFQGTNSYSYYYRCKQSTTLLKIPIEIFKKMVAAKGELRQRAMGYLKNRSELQYQRVQPETTHSRTSVSPTISCPANKKIEENRLEHSMHRYTQILNYNGKLMTEPCSEQGDSILFGELRQLVENKGKLKEISQSRQPVLPGRIQKCFNPRGVSSAQRLSRGVIQQITKENKEKEKPRSQSGTRQQTPSDISRVFSAARKVTLDLERHDYEIFQKQIDEQLNKVPQSMDQVQQIIQNIQLILINKNLKRQYGPRLGRPTQEVRQAQSPPLRTTLFSTNCRKQKNFARFQHQLQVQKSNESFDKAEDKLQPMNHQQNDELVQVLKNIKRLNNDNMIDHQMIKTFFGQG